MFGQKGDHDTKGPRVTISGGAGDDVKHYQERDVRHALNTVKAQ